MLHTLQSAHIAFNSFPRPAGSQLPQVPSEVPLPIRIAKHMDTLAPGDPILMSGEVDLSLLSTITDKVRTSYNVHK